LRKDVSNEPKEIRGRNAIHRDRAAPTASLQPASDLGQSGQALLRKISDTYCVLSDLSLYKEVRVSFALARHVVDVTERRFSRSLSGM